MAKLSRMHRMLFNCANGIRFIQRNLRAAGDHSKQPLGLLHRARLGLRRCLEIDSFNETNG